MLDSLSCSAGPNMVSEAAVAYSPGVGSRRSPDRPAPMVVGCSPGSLRSMTQEPSSHVLWFSLGGFNLQMQPLPYVRTSTISTPRRNRTVRLPLCRPPAGRASKRDVSRLETSGKTTPRRRLQPCRRPQAASGVADGLAIRAVYGLCDKRNLAPGKTFCASRRSFKTLCRVSTLNPRP